ncbi:MAG: hypothetical protein JSW47_01235 [Phycisphaerales bacterium]|nr:MAG: hypothetical protein JSW47_01235 [Phycisphaerales bacterium]UCF14195.1 MAG: hypothetical protein JSW59_12345 [Phycisphaerales bacterium]
MRNQDNQYMMRACLFACVILTSSVASGTLCAGEITPKSEVAPPTATVRTDPTERLQEVSRKLSQVHPVINIMQQKLPFLLDRIKGIDNIGLRDTLARFSEEYATFQAKFGQLERELDELRKIHESKQKDAARRTVAELEQQLKEAEEKKKALEDKLSRVQSTPRYVRLTKRPKYVLLYKGRVAPINEPYYGIATRGYVRQHGRNIPAMKVKRIKEGEPVGQAIKPGGCLDQLLSKLDPDKECVNFQVCMDSITAFRVAVEHLRNRKIAYAWEPEEDREFVFTGGASSVIWGENLGK